ncbi:hypothetical protein [Saccharibacillus deserti]|uniref:hypothetical protein n=1 Tax=Saccharibacillus deserti TaxID=1634444 RepID=UPI0015528946|nr:hypothetical protein [Saccharibacillus deserti]
MGRIAAGGNLALIGSGLSIGRCVGVREDGAFPRLSDRLVRVSAVQVGLNMSKAPRTSRLR